MKIWRLKRGGDVRFRQGHPWIFSGELAHSSRDVEAGEVVELRDAADHFLAYGMAHPSSNICFRKLSGRQKEKDVLSIDFFLRRLQQARAVRETSDWTRFSHRWIFSEVDGLPGLVVDRFAGPQDLASFQISTAGMERARDEFLTALEQSGVTHWVESSTSSSRKTEGLTPSRRESSGKMELENVKIALRHLSDQVSVSANFSSGQKTGFFLDQQWNTQLLLQLLPKRLEKLRVLDLCSYVGQWSTQLAKWAQDARVPMEVDLVDTSSEALQLAQANVAQYGGAARTLEMDVGDEWANLHVEYDVVICDPPAFVKKKADLAKALAAYTRLNREAIKRVAPGGLIVTCSCSGAVRPADFNDALAAARSKAGRAVKWLAQGGHAPDHPVMLEFPEGQYLKCLIGQVDFPY